ncbi:MAG: tetratricopeptide repeat protein [Phycisphaerales bacterium]|nr:tetratricopeptide repeat protein [Phycisphaerales bacterium]
MAQKPDRTLEQTRQVMDLYKSGRFDQALAAARRVLQKSPAQPHANQVAGIILARRGQPEQAMFHITRALAGSPGDATLHVTHGQLLLSLQRIEDAVAAFDRAIALSPGLASASIGKATALQQLFRYEEAIDCFHAALRLNPDAPDAYLNLANLQLDLARADHAVDTLRQAARRFPENPIVWTSLSNAINYPSGVSASETFAPHQRYGAIIEKGWRDRPFTFPNTPEPARRLRIGYLSPDMRRHSVAYFLHSILKAHDPATVEVFCYSLTSHPDDMTDALRALAHEWRDGAGLDDAALEQRIRRDRIDILVEMAGHFAGHRLLMLARRPAPVQVTYLGYAHTTGLRNIQYRLVDHFTDPPASPSHAAEELFRLPDCFICYTPPDDAPEPAAPPSSTGAPFTFASFNEAKKISHELVALWARVLAAVPDSRLLLKAASFENAFVRAEVTQRLASHGLAPDRIEVVARIPSRAEHLAFYSRVDLALDTFPYHGTTTTCEAMWMGVPVISLVGDRHAARVGSSLLHAVGLDDLMAHSPDDYVRIASSLAADRPRLALIRASLRDRMRSSPLCDAPRFTRNLEVAYRHMWARWCAKPR